MRVVILEDNVERQQGMRAAVADRFPAFTVEFFAGAMPMIAHLQETGLYDVALLSLDHDLEVVANRSGRSTDPGTGVDVAAWLAEQPAVAPAIVHTTNVFGGDRMSELLAAAGWTVNRTIPFGDTEWIGSAWRPLVRELIVDHCPTVSMSSLGAAVIRCAIRFQKAGDWPIRELLKAAGSLLIERGKVPTFCIEFLYLNAGGRLRKIAGTGMPVMREFFGGIPLEIIESSAEALGQGPLAPDCKALDPAFASLLREQHVHEIQLDVVQPRPGLQAMLFSASVDEDAPLAGHTVQATLRELKTLLELVLLIEMQGDTDVQEAGQSLLTSPPRRN